VLACLGACVFVVLVWYAGTGVILLADRRPRSTYLASMMAATAILVAAVFGIVRSRTDTSWTGAVLGFACGIAVWGWLEMTFLLGYVTGPRPPPCSPRCHGWRHFLHAFQAILYHELTLLAVIGTLTVTEWHSANRVAMWTLLILWGMRTSAKLNLFLGVRNTGSELLPEPLRYLRVYLRRRPLNLLFPFSITAATTLLALLVRPLLTPGLGEFPQAACALLASLTALGLLEHWMLVAPFSVARLWVARPRRAATALKETPA